VWFNQKNEINQTNQINEIPSSRRKLEIMPQDMVVRNLSYIDLSTAPNGKARQVSDPYNPKYLLIIMPYRFNTNYQLLAHSSEYLLCDWFLSLDLQRSRP